MRYFYAFFLLTMGWFLQYSQTVAQSTQEQLKQIRSTVIENIGGRDYYIHTIRRGQTLYMISKAYGVEVNDIIRENPGVREGIRADQKLRILVPGQKDAPIPKVTPGKDKTDARKETRPEVPGIESKTDSVVIPILPCGQDMTTKKSVYKVALMLPLFLSGFDQIDAENPDPGIFETSRCFQFLPYYEGFLMALDSLEQIGVKIKLYVYDVDKDTVKTRQLLKKQEMRSMDLIFGLLYHSNFKIVASFAKKNKINLVNPISERSELISGNPYIFKVQPSKKDQVEQLAAYMSGAFTGGQILIIRNGRYREPDAPDRLKKACLERDLPVQVVESQEAAIGKYSKINPNYIVVFFDNQTYTLDFLKNLYKIRNEYDLTLVGLPEWPDMGGLETEYLVALKTHMMGRSFIDYDNQSVRHFVDRYQEKYKTDPELLAFQGFDQAIYFLSALNRYGTDIGRCIGELKIPGIQTRFEFSQTRGNGFENRRWMMFKYDNYRLVPVN